MLMDGNELPPVLPKMYRLSHCGDNDDYIYPWTSPLSVQWHDRHARTCLEMPVTALARLTHCWIATFLDRKSQAITLTDAVLQSRLHLRQEIERFIDVDVSITNEQTAVLACCRWATSIMLKVDQAKVPIWKAAQEIPTQPNVVAWLRMTSLRNLWNSKSGYLFWVVSIYHQATAGQCFPLLTTALQAHFAHIMAQSEQYHAIAIVPLSRLFLFERVSCNSKEPASANQE